MAGRMLAAVAAALAVLAWVPSCSVAAPTESKSPAHASPAAASAPSVAAAPAAASAPSTAAPRAASATASGSSPGAPAVASAAPSSAAAPPAAPAAGSPPSAAPVSAAPETVDITILHLNDPHGRLEPYAQGAGSIGGYARVATMADDARAAGRAARVFLVHAGDEFSRGDDLTRASLGAANLAIMNHLKFDLWVPGNGDFYDGLTNIAARIREAKFPVLAANVKVKASDKPVAKPYVVEQAGPVRVAFLGLCFLQPLDASFDSFNVAEPLATARDLVPQLRKQADVVVAVTHIGAPFDRRLAETVPGIDVVIGAHTHNVFPRGLHYKAPDGRDVLVCMAGEYMNYLGKVDLKLAKADGPSRAAGAGDGWRVASATDVLIPIDDKVKLDPTVKALIARLAEQYLKPAAPANSAAPARQAAPAPAP